MSSYLRKRNDSQVVLLKERLAEEEKQKEINAMTKAFAEINPLDHSSTWSRLFFSWVAPVLKHSKKYQIDIEELGKVKLGDDVRE